MLKTGICFFILCVTSIGQTPSLYSDNAIYSQSTDDTNDAFTLDNQIDTTKETTRYIDTVFRLNQLTPKLRYLTDESIVYSHISRMDGIIDHFHTQIEELNEQKITYPTTESNARIERHYQHSMYKLSLFSPYIASVLTKDSPENIQHIHTLTMIADQLEATIQTMTKYNQQLGVHPQNQSLPFMPSSPFELSFALETQLNNSILNAFSDSSSSETTPYASFATPANAALFNQGGVDGFNQHQALPSLHPLGQTSGLPNF